MHYETIHRQQVLLPDASDWEKIVAEGTVAGLPLLQPSGVTQWLSSWGALNVAKLGLVEWKGKWWSLPLLLLNGYYYRVHFENVICEHCGQRCGPSATLDTTAYALAGYSTAEAIAEFAKLSVQSCPHCHGLLRQRHTVWLQDAGEA